MGPLLDPSLPGANRGGEGRRHFSRPREGRRRRRKKTDLTHTKGQKREEKEGVEKGEGFIFDGLILGFSFPPPFFISLFSVFPTIREKHMFDPPPHIGTVDGVFVWRGRLIMAR